MNARWYLSLAIAMLLIAGVWLAYRGKPRLITRRENQNETAPGVFRFVDVARQAGVDFTYFRGETGEYWLTETTGGGVGLIDFDGDGWLDIYFVNGCRQPRDPADFTHTSRLVRNLGNGQFADVTGPTGVGHNGYGQGCTVGDFDNDGFDDLYVTCFGSNVLYHNQGDGTFREVTGDANADCPLWSTGSAFGDFDRDGDLDLFVANYVDFDPKTAPRCGDPHTGQRGYCGPSSFGPLPDFLFANLGDGSFTDVNHTAGINMPDGTPRPESKGLGVQVFDFDDDGWLDIFVANDKTPSFLFHNLGGLSFREVGMTQGVALTGDGSATATMGIACGDYDRDGRTDLLTTNFYLEGATLFHNLGERGFRDETASAGLSAATRAVLGWGTAFGDFDNDGWLDLFAANGHVHHDRSGLEPYAMPAQLFRNSGHGTFTDLSRQAGPYFQTSWNGRGAAFGDIDNDGDTDIVVVHHHQAAAILRNDSPATAAFLSLRLIGVRSDRNALGTRVAFSIKDSVDEGPRRDFVRHVNVSGSYLSSNDPRVILGKATGSSLRQIEFRWNSGLTIHRPEQAAGVQNSVREPTGN